MSSCEISICRNERTQLAGSCSRYMWSPDPPSRSKIRAKAEMHRTFSQTCLHSCKTQLWPCLQEDEAGVCVEFASWNGRVGAWVTRNVKSMPGMFQNSRFNQDISEEAKKKRRIQSSHRRRIAVPSGDEDSSTKKELTAQQLIRRLPRYYDPKKDPAMRPKTVREP